MEVLSSSVCHGTRITKYNLIELGRTGYFEFVHIVPVRSDIDGFLRHGKWQVEFCYPGT